MDTLQSVKRLLRLVVSAFYTPLECVCIDVLISENRKLKDSEVAGLLHLGVKQVCSSPSPFLR